MTIKMDIFILTCLMVETLELHLISKELYVIEWIYISIIRGCFYEKKNCYGVSLVMSICSISTVNASTYYMIYCNGQYWEDLKDVRDEIIIPEDNVVSRTVIEVQYTENHFGGGGITGYSDSKKRGVPEPPNKYTMIEPEYIYDYPLSEVKRLLNEWADRNGIEKKTFE